MFLAEGFIAKKRDGGAHGEDELREFVRLVRDGVIPDYQTSAWLMAVYFKGLSDEEVRAFTRALAESGETVMLPPGAPTSDKHSTGGVGDKTTLIVAPLAAACGLRVAKLSGRGLGFTGGTVDKLESIPGMSTRLTREAFISQVESIGLAVSGHSAALAPAEGKFYALRDVTATVPSIPLIASSIISKKLAGGAGSFVFDVKCGSGAFMKDARDARALAGALNGLSAALGRQSSCVISNMSAPLGECVGNALEVREAIDVLSGGGPADTRELSLVLAAEMLRVSGLEPDEKEARALAARKLDGGEALAVFGRVVAAQGGDPSVCEHPESVLPRAPKVKMMTASDSGIFRADALAAGLGVRALGGGRERKEDSIDPSAGLRLLKRPGEAVTRGEPIAELHYSDDERLAAALPIFEGAFSFGGEKTPSELILERVAE